MHNLFSKSTMLVLGLVIILGGCECPSDDAPDQTFYFNNITILLDFSSRVQQPHQIEKDKQIIRQILDWFEENQRKYSFQISREKIQVLLAYQKDAISNTFGLGDGLSIDMGASQMNHPEFKKEKEDFLSAIDSLYSSALKNPMNGADIWTFFRDSKPMFHVVSDQDKYVFYNKVIILTDGYLRFDQKISSKRAKNTYMRNKDIRKLRNKQDWKNIFTKGDLSLKPHIGMDYQNLSVLMLEIKPENPSVNTNEFDILEYYWKDWFEIMNVPCEVVRTQDDPLGLKPKIHSFLEIKVMD